MSRINYKNILDNLRTVLTASNTTTADYYLSTNMSSQINTISKRNPAFIVGQPSKFPIICLRIDSDNKEYSEVGRTTNPRQSTVDISIIGMLFYNPLTEGTLDDDPADDQIRYFAENVEEVIRKNPRLGLSSVLYSYIDKVSFYEDLDEEAYFRTFVMDYKVKLFH